MELAFMRFCGKFFADNLTQVKISVGRDVSAQRLCSGENLLQNKGTQLRTVSGSGELRGADAAERMEYMRTVFSVGEKGALIMPDYEPIYALLRELTFTSQGESGDIFYQFEFYEQPRSRITTPLSLRHTVSAGDNLWTLAQDYCTTVEELLRLNPQIIRPDWLKEGEEVTILWR